MSQNEEVEPDEEESSSQRDEDETGGGGNEAQDEFHSSRQPHGGHFRNAFFRPPGEGDSERPRRGRVYAAIEVPDEESDFSLNRAKESEAVYLECVDADWLQRLEQSSLHLKWSDVAHSAPLSVLELTKEGLPTFSVGFEPGDIAWFEFRYEMSREEESDARIYDSLFSEGVAVKISERGSQPKGWQGIGPMGVDRWIGQAPSKFQLSARSFAQWKRRLTQIQTDGGVAFYDVGQGACQAAVDGSMQLPSLYVDFGGGVLTNRKTFPEDFAGFCFTQSPPIILSHWDWDHWSSAQRFPASLEAEWLAPPVPEKPIQQAFAAELFARGSLTIWDGTWPQQLDAGQVMIERCTGRVVNDSGLAVTLHPRRGSTRNCLLPGDAAYAHIPSVTANNAFNILCMTHHGGRLHSPVYPEPKRGAVSVLSAGPRNSYRHPMFETLAYHVERGWKFPTGTALSGQRPCHVFAPWGGRPHIFQGGCHVGGCATAIAAIAPACVQVHGLAEPVHHRVSASMNAKAKATVA